VHTLVKQPADGHKLDVDTRTYNMLLRSLRCLSERGLALLTQRWRALQHVTASPSRIGDLAKAALVLGTVPGAVFPARHAGRRSGGMGTVSDDIERCESTEETDGDGRQLSPEQAAAAAMVAEAKARGLEPTGPNGLLKLFTKNVLEQLAGAAADLLAGQLEQAAEHLQVLPPGQQLIDRRELPRQAEQLANGGRLAHDVVAEDLRPPRIRRQQRGQNAHQRGLARSVRAQQAKHHPTRDLEPGTIQRHGRPEPLDHTPRPAPQEGVTGFVEFR
jgi:hypothetical protein